MSEVKDMVLGDLLEHEDALVRFQALILKQAVEDWLRKEMRTFECLERVHC